jgi:hypothetical protein
MGASADHNKSLGRFSALAETLGGLVDSCIRLGLISGAGIAVAFGQFLLGGILAALALGMFLRFKRGRISR